MILEYLLSGLDYFPGVHSRRWSGDAEDDLGRNKRILELMKNNRTNETRGVYLISRFSLCTATDEIYKTVVKNKFTLSTEIHGEHGFGYDTILIPSWSLLDNAIWHGRISKERAFEIHDKLCIGDLSQEEKNAINNRGRIAKQISEFLGEYNG